MAEIVGTITNLSDFLSKTQVCLSVKPNDPQQQIICLEADRKYSIPAFQREVRWDDNNLKMLLYDLSRSSKFLGNIILTIKSDHTCEIIDGQQRTTVLMFTQLALVNKTAVNKLEEFESLISQRPELLQKCIIFVQTMEYGAKLQEILVRYSDKYHTYYADDEKINLENFAAGKIDCLLTCKKVSEGIDISSVTNIILFSSDRSRLVTTQRIGRALRLDKNNPEKKATVVDFVIGFRGK